MATERAASGARVGWEWATPRLAVAAIGFALVTLFTVLVAHPRIFTGFAVYDDEGYMLVALKSFIDHGALYDVVFSQYGPFYYEAWGGLFSLFGIPVTHDSGRMATLVVWVLTSLGFGIATFRMASSIVLGLAAQMMVFAVIGTLTNEPMHPGGIICLLLAAIVLISTGVRASLSPGMMMLLGGAVAALVLVKVNVGAFALVAVALACSASYPALAKRRWLRLLVEIVFVATPIVLMASKLDEDWVREYAFHVTAAALAIVIALRTRDSGTRPTEELWWLGGGFVVTALAILAAALGSGSSVGGLFEGIVAQPLRQSDAFSIPLVQSTRFFYLDAAALGAAVTYWYVSRGRDPVAPVWQSIVSLFAVLIGVEMALATIGADLPFDAAVVPGYQFSLLAFAWVALLPSHGAPREVGFARLLLPPLAVLQALHAFPVAGSQLHWSAFLLVPVAALCVASGARGLAHALSDARERRALGVLGAVAATVLMGFIANATIRKPSRDNREAWEAAVSLDLPGARSVRLDEPTADLYRSISRAIDANCGSFVMLPGMGSFYFWTDQDPPTGYVATAWPTLFDADAQRQVIDDTRSIAGLCLLENESLAVTSWGEIPDGPLVRYLKRGFEPVAGFGDYQLLKREAPAGVTS